MQLEKGVVPKVIVVTEPIPDPENENVESVPTSNIEPDISSEITNLDE